MKRWHAAKSGRRWSLVGECGAELSADGMADLCEQLGQLGRVAVFCRDPQSVIELAAWLRDQAHVTSSGLPSVSARGTGGGSITVAGCRQYGAAWFMTTGHSLVADRDAHKSPAGPPPDTDDAAELARWSCELAMSFDAVAADLGLPTGKLSAGSCAASILPKRWLKAAVKLGRSQPWQDVRKAYIGGRVACFQPGWSGEAVEYDLRIAYGAALAGLLGPMPDCQLYPDRSPRRAAPAWLDVTIECSGDPPPLPRRDPEKPWRLLWHTGRWRGWYTAADLDTPGVRIVEIHACHRGRFRSSLRHRVVPLLEARENGDAWQRAVIRQLVVSLAGKLGQRPIEWRLWSPAQRGKLPPGAVHVGDPWGGDGLTIYPTTPDRWPPSLVPMVASYVTARTRRRLFDAIHECGPDRVIYCDTDSIHVPAGSVGPSDCGSAAGQWSIKESGSAEYHDRRRYRIGSKRVNC